MTDIRDLILADHATFRQSFAALFAEDRASEPERLLQLWTPLGHLLDRHAGAEEATFYPVLLRVDRDSGDETRDAIGDHNKIRDAVRAAAAATPGSEAWWSAVEDARKENDEHMKEEEEGPLHDIGTHADEGRREQVGADFVSYKQAHPGSWVDTTNKDPEAYTAGR